MKKSLLVLAALGTLSGLASAQSEITIFGVVDASLRSVKNGSLGTIQSLSTGSESSSRLGFRGTEELGNGWSAGFWLESDLQNDIGGAGGNAIQTAPANQLWNRRSVVTLKSNTLGEVRLGRDYVPTWFVMSNADPFNNNGVAGTGNIYVSSASAVNSSAFGAGTNASSIVRVNNSVQYYLPRNLGGVYGFAMASAAERTSVALGGTKGYGGRIGYAAGPLDVTVAMYTTQNIPTHSDFRDVAMSACYDFGVVKLSLGRRQLSYLSAKVSDTLFGVSSRVGLGTIKFSYSLADQSGRVGTTSINANDASQLGLGYVYDLSKRTALVATYAYLSNKGSAFYTIPAGPSANAATFGGQTSSGYEFGLRHFF